MKAIFEFDAPESCAECPLSCKMSVPVAVKKGVFEMRTRCLPEKAAVTDFYNQRAPFCPLKIVPNDAEEFAELHDTSADAQFITHAREDIPFLLSENKCLNRVVDAYARSARTVALWLKKYCDNRLSYDEMIVDAARKAAKEIDLLTAELKQYRHNNAPTVDAVAVVHGEWVGKMGATCSECGYIDIKAYIGQHPNYCAGCGAKMGRGESE